VRSSRASGDPHPSCPCNGRAPPRCSFT